MYLDFYRAHFKVSEYMNKYCKSIGATGSWSVSIYTCIYEALHLHTDTTTYTLAHTLTHTHTLMPMHTVLIKLYL